LVENLTGRFALLDVQEVITAHQLDCQGAVVAGFAPVEVVLRIVIKVLRSDAVGGQPGRLWGCEPIGETGATGLIKADGLVVERTKAIGEIVVLHVARRKCAAKPNATAAGCDVKFGDGA